MPDEIKDALNRVASTLPPVNWPAPEQLRRRGTARRRVQVLTAVLAVAAVVAVGSAAVRPRLGPDGGGPGAAPAAAPPVMWSCESGRPFARISLPDQRDISVNVYNGTSTASLARDIGQELKQRGFQLVRTGDAADIGVDAAGRVAVIRYGPQEVGAAWVVYAYFPDAQLDFDVHRPLLTVDIVLGDRFVALPTITEVNQQIAMNGRAVAPPGTCPTS